MDSLNKWLSMGVPSGWADVVISTLKVAVVAFVVLQLKEWFDAGAFDTPATAVDAGLIAAGVFALNAILMWVSADRSLAIDGPKSVRQ